MFDKVLNINLQYEENQISLYNDYVTIRLFKNKPEPQSEKNKKNIRATFPEYKLKVTMKYY